jgi:predicted nucleotidyltransferase
MSVNDAFAEFQAIVNADMDSVREARRRRDLFKSAFVSLEDVLEVLPSGSLARGTQKDPINDVDVVVVFDEADHPEWGAPGDSARDALDYTRAHVNALLGVTNGTHAKEVRLARWRNHAVKCFFDDPDDPEAFTVDAMPALRRDGHLLVPEAVSNAWIECDPEHLIHLVAARHAEWDKFAGCVRMLKKWASDQDLKIKSLVMEVLALDHLPASGSRAGGIKQFFVAAAYLIEGGGEVHDPAGLCGPIQGDLDYESLADRLREAADLATRAFTAQSQNDERRAIELWRELFGPDFPEPPSTYAAPAAPAAPRAVKDTPQG